MRPLYQAHHWLRVITALGSPSFFREAGSLLAVPDTGFGTGVRLPGDGTGVGTEIGIGIEIGLELSLRP